VQTDYNTDLSCCHISQAADRHVHREENTKVKCECRGNGTSKLSAIHAVSAGPMGANRYAEGILTFLSKLNLITQCFKLQEVIYTRR